MADNVTTFSEIYQLFLSKVTDDMYLELDRNDTEKLLRELLLNSLHWFEFPRQNIYDYSEVFERFNIELTTEEKNIIATYMIVEWIGQQLASVENTRMKYSGTDFKFTSQANHMQKLQSMKNHYRDSGFHLQRLYKRRVADRDGIMKTTMHTVMEPYDFAKWTRNSR